MDVPRGQPLADPAAATAAALAEPLDYPPLAQSTTPGDRVVLALDRGVPQVAQVTAAVVRCPGATPASIPTASASCGVRPTADAGGRSLPADRPRRFDGASRC